MGVTTRDRARGVMLGLATGDALGRPVEFKSAAEIERRYGTVTEMVGEGTWNQPPGTITDDTEMALAIARSLTEREQFDPGDIGERFVEWYESGPFDIVVIDREEEPYRFTCPNGHVRWDKTNDHIWCASTTQLPLAGSETPALVIGPLYTPCGSSNSNIEMPAGI